MRTLVACPVAARKHYSFPLWVEQTEKYDRLVSVDDPEYALKVEEYGVPYVLFTPVSTRRVGGAAIYGPRHTEAWAAILERADGYTHILSLESDIIAPRDVDILSLMEEHYDDSYDFTCHAYPWRYPHRKGLYAHETGCTIGSIDKWKRALRLTHKDHGVYETIRITDYFRNKDIHIVELEHLGEGDDRF
jgi:hypothetical protein